MNPKLRILIVDDDRDLASNLQDILESENYEASTAGTGGEALDLAHKQVFDIALVDVRLPDTPGMALIERLVGLCPGLESILMTGFASLETAVEAIRQKSIVAYEVKPVNIDRLLALLGQVARKKRLERELLDVRERERVRIGRELHDGLGQKLTGVALHARVLVEALKAKKLLESEQASRIEGLVNESIHEASRLARGLAPVILETKGLRSALEELAEAVQTGSLSCRLEWDARVAEPGCDIAIHIYRLIQEAMNNAAKHAKASSIRVSVDDLKADTILRVFDDGSGLPRDAFDRGGMGLKLMRDRAGVIGASFEIGPNPTGGTLIQVRCRQWGSGDKR